MSHRRRGLSHGATSAVLAIMLAGGAAATNPSRADHRQAIERHCQASAGVFGAMGCSLGLGLGSAVGVIQYDDYILFSRLRVDQRTLSSGVLGYVHVWRQDGTALDE